MQATHGTEAVFECVNCTWPYNGQPVLLKNSTRVAATGTERRLFVQVVYPPDATDCRRGALLVATLCHFVPWGFRLGRPLAAIGTAQSRRK